MAKPEKRKLQRVQYWQGQTLKSRDFRDIAAMAAQRRWWHNRALHNAYGIYKGFAVSVTSDSSAVEVRPGVAYDCFGRELILQTRQRVDPPITSGRKGDRDFYLLARYRESGCSGIDESSGVCWGQPGPSLLETVEFVWKLKSSVILTDGVPIAGIVFTEIKEFRLQLDFPRPSAQPLASPLLATGSTAPGNTPWTPWTAGESFATTPVPELIGVQTTIDTSAAGFTDIPVYFAWLEGPLWNPQTQQLAPAQLSSISQEATGSFTFQIWLPAQPRGDDSSVGGAVSQSAPATSLVDADAFLSFAKQQDLYVSWIGCQCLSACRETKTAASPQSSTPPAPSASTPPSNPLVPVIG